MLVPSKRLTLVKCKTNVKKKVIHKSEVIIKEDKDYIDIPNAIKCYGIIKYVLKNFYIYVKHPADRRLYISVDPDQLLLDNITHVYALPNNTDYTKWTKLAITEQNKNIINSDNWSRFYDQQPIYGYIDLTTDTFFTHVGTINKCAQNTKQTDGISENE